MTCFEPCGDNAFKDEMPELWRSLIPLMCDPYPIELVRAVVLDLLNWGTDPTEDEEIDTSAWICPSG